MPRRDLPPKIRAIVMQSLLVAVFGATVGLAAIVTRHVRSSMRVEMGEPRTLGGITVAFPAGWSNTSLAGGEREELSATEPDRGFGRTLRVVQQRAQGMASPLEHLIRSNQIKPDVLRSLADRREGFALQNVSIGGWPGQMLVVPPRPGAPEKAVIACAVLPAAKAVVVGLQGSEALDATDVELVRQVCEHTTIATATTTPKLTLSPPAWPMRLVDEIEVAAPPQYLEAGGADENELQKHLVYDGARAGGGGGWVGIDLTSCVFFAEDREETLLAMLAARDAEWRGGPVRRLGPRTWVVDRPAPSEVTGGAGATSFPSRAYLSANVDGRALLVVMHGGPRDARMFDPAWQAIAASLKFEGTKDLTSLLTNGAEAAGRLGGGRLAELLPREGGEADHGEEAWYVWDAWANAGQELWTKLTWHAAMKDGTWESLGGTRATEPVAAYAGDTRFDQTWTAAADLSTYQVTTSREVTRGGGGGRSRTRFEQRVSVDHGRMTLAVDVGTSLPDVAAPAQYVPGAIVPLVMRELAERPALIRTESFCGIETVAPGGLLTLFVTRLADAPPRLDDAGEPMECVTVGVNGTGVVSRWYYTAGDEPGSHELRFIDFAGGLKAAAGGRK